MKHNKWYFTVQLSLDYLNSDHPNSKDSATFNDQTPTRTCALSVHVVESFLHSD